MYLWVYVHVYKCLWRQEDGVKSHAAGGSGGCGYWEPSSGHLQDQQELLTVEPSLQTVAGYFSVSNPQQQNACM